MLSEVEASQGIAIEPQRGSIMLNRCVARQRHLRSKLAPRSRPRRGRTSPSMPLVRPRWGRDSGGHRLPRVTLTRHPRLSMIRRFHRPIRDSHGDEYEILPRKFALIKLMFRTFAS